MLPGEQRCRIESQWPAEGLVDESGNPRYDLIIATDPFAYVPSLTTDTNIIHDEEPHYLEALGLDRGAFEFGSEFKQALTNRTRRAVTEFLQQSSVGPDTYGGFIELARQVASCDASFWNEHASPSERPGSALSNRWKDALAALEHEPEEWWYREVDGAHTLAPALTRGIWKAITGNIDPTTDPGERGGGVYDRNGRATATVSHSPPRPDAAARSDYGWNQTYVTVVLGDDNTIQSIQNVPDLSSARSVVGLDARPCRWTWQRNGHPDMEVESVLDREETQLWRRLERGQTVVKVGRARRPAGKNGQYWTEGHAQELIGTLLGKFGEDFRAVGGPKAFERDLRRVMREHGVSEEEIRSLHFNEEFSRNDFAREVVGLVYGSIDPGDEFVLDLLAECGLDAVPARSEESCQTCDGEGCSECDRTGHERAHGREFVGPDAEHARELLDSVRATALAQMIGRFGRDLGDGESNLTFVAGGPVPDDLVDYVVPGVERPSTSAQRDIVEAAKRDPGVTTTEVIDEVGYSRKHVIETLARTVENGGGRRDRGGGVGGADRWYIDEDAGGGRTDLRLDEIVTDPVNSSSTGSVMVGPPTVLDSAGHVVISHCDGENMSPNSEGSPLIEGDLPLDDHR